METVKRFFGVLLLGVAIYLVGPLVPTAVQMLAWAALLIVTAMYLRAIDPLPPGAHGFQRFAKGIGVIALVAGIVFMVGAFSGGRDILRPLGGLVGEASVAPVAFNRVSSPAELDRALKAAGGRPVMLDFYADWCVSCKEMERYTFSDPQVRKRLESLVLLQADVTGNTPEHQALLQRFRLFGPPGIVFFDRPGSRDIRLAGDRIPAGRAVFRGPRPGARREMSRLTPPHPRLAGRREADAYTHLAIFTSARRRYGQRCAGGPPGYRWSAAADRRRDAGADVATLPNLDGKSETLGQWRGKVLVVNFWATWCAPCREEIPVFVKLQKKYGGQGLQFVGIAIDQPEKSPPLCRRAPNEFPGTDRAHGLDRAHRERSAIVPGCCHLP